MTKQVLGVLAALAMVSGPALGMVACSSSDSTGTPTDSGVPTDSKVTDSKPTDSKPPVVVDGDVGGMDCDKTTGAKCATADDCDKTGNGINICAAGAFAAGSLYPTPVCIGTECDPGDGTKITGCDCDTGVCLSTSSGGICLPVCEFADSADAPKGCEGANACNVYGWGKDTMTMATIGIGYCFGGCKADTECPTGEKCQKEDGLCVKAPVVYTKMPGDACVKADAGTATVPAKCNCLYTTKEGTGYCANVCRFGETTCGTGFSCDSGLPKTKLRDDDTVFSAVPKGIAGYCLKNCTTDADCTALNAYCDENAGMAGQKTCQLGKRRCATNANCPTGQTCTGATATELGTCG
jgi:hypothetical protein